MFKYVWKVVYCSLLALLFLNGCQPAGEATMSIVALATSEPTNPLPSPTSEKIMNAHWVYQTAGAIWGSPALSDEIIFIGSDDGNLYALDTESGSLKWKFTSQGIVRSQPAIANGRVYFASDDGILYAINKRNGKPVWSADIGNSFDRATRENLGTSTSPTGYDYVQSSPVVADGSVYVGSRDGNLYALSAATGKIKWKVATADKIRATPTVDQGNVYVGSWDKLFYAIDARTGKVRWTSPVGGQVQSPALVANNLVYCASRKASLVALDAQTGELKWEYSYGSNMWVESSPRLVGDVIYIGSSGSRFVLGLDALTGKPTTIFNSPDFHWSTPLVIGDILYIGGTSFKPEKTGGLYSLKIVEGKFSRLDQDRQVFSVADTMEAYGNWSGVASSPATDGDLIFFGGLDGKVYAVNALP